MTTEDREAIPEGLRTRYSEKDTEEYYERIEPITVLRRQYCSIYAEILCVTAWMKDDADGGVHYMVNFVQPHRRPFGKDQKGTVSADYGFGCSDQQFGDFNNLRLLMDDVEKYIRKHDKNEPRRIRIRFEGSDQELDVR